MPPLTAKNCHKSGQRKENWEKLRKNQEKEEKSKRKGQNWEGSFTLPLLTNRAGYATGTQPTWIDLLTKVSY